MALQHPVFALEQAAMRRWCNGDPDGFLEISDAEVSYFDPFIPRRIDGLDALLTHYDALRGKIFATSYDFLDVRVQEAGDVAILPRRAFVGAFWEKLESSGVTSSQLMHFRSFMM